MPEFIYLDGHASTPLAPEVGEIMTYAWKEAGNPGSPHAAGARASALVEQGRNSLAQLIGALPSELIFTSGATEANNLAISGCARAARLRNESRNRIIVSAIEHKSVMATALALVADGYEVRLAPVGPDGMIDTGALAELVDERTLLVSVAVANGEIGVIQPMTDVVRLARHAGALVHSDLAQLAGRCPVNVTELDLDYASISGHKMYGPVGIGSLFVSAMAPALTPLTHGGGQERGLRSGTVPAPLVAGFGEAARLVRERLAADASHTSALAEQFKAALTSANIEWSANAGGAHRLPGSLSLKIKGVNADSLVDRLSNKVALSTGSACQSGQVEPSHVLKAIGLSDDEQRECFRICFGRFNNPEESRLAASLVADAIRQEWLATGGVLQ